MYCKVIFIYKNRHKIISYLNKYFIKLLNNLLKILRKIKKIPKNIIKKTFSILPINIKKSLLSNSAISEFRNQNNARWYIRGDLSIEQFFKELNKIEVSYLILRWWEILPIVEKDEDIDILIEDYDLKKIKHLITKCVMKQKLDIYTVNGTHGGMYKDIPYYPKKLSVDLLKNKVLYKNNYYVPNDEYYFYSLSYHALFHKGNKSGLDGFILKEDYIPEHNYRKYLQELVSKMELKILINKKELFEVLKERNYLPSMDLIAKLSDMEKSVRIFLPKLSCDIRGGEMSLFVIREKAINDNYLDLIKDTIKKSFKMEIIDEISLSLEQKEFLSDNMRGANWRNGPYSKSGGEPSVILSVYDYHPSPLSNKSHMLYPHFTNENLLKCKNKIRNIINSKKLIFKQYNAIHTTDNEAEALYFLNKLVDNKKFIKLKDLVEEKREEYKTIYPIVKVLSTGRRSKVELIKFNNDYAIKKTFRKKYQVFFEREVYAHIKLAEKIKYIPKLLEKGENYIITQFYDEILNSKQKNKILNINKRKVFKIFSSLYYEGFAHINLTPGNILVSKDEKLYLIDFEFLHKYENKPNTLNESFDLVGVPDDLEIDLPSGYSNILNSYNCQWKKLIGSFDVKG